MIYAANKLIEYGSKNVLIKGGHLKSKLVHDIFVNQSDIKIFKKNKSKKNNFRSCYGSKRWSSTNQSICY